MPLARMLLSLSLLLVGTDVVAGGGQAQTGSAVPAGNSDALVDALGKCGGIANAARRLACYDEAAKALLDARARKDVVVVDRAEVRRKQRSQFGLPAAQVRRPKPDTSDDAEPSEISSTVADSSIGADGLVFVALADGSRWRSVEAGPVSPPQRGSAITVRKGALGSYFIRFSRFSLHAHRLR